jgi:hypothetical protein
MTRTEVTWGAVAILGVMVGSIGWLIVGSNYPYIWALSVGLLLVAVLPFLYEAVARRIDPFAPIFWTGAIFIALYAGPAIERLVEADFSFAGIYTSVYPPNVIMAYVLASVLIGLLCIYYGYYHVAGRRIASRLPQFKQGWSSRRAWILISVLTLVGGIGYLTLPGGGGPRSHLAKGSSKFSFMAVNLLITSSILIMADIAIRHVDYANAVVRFSSPRKFLGGGILIVANINLLWTLGGRARSFGILVIGTFLTHYFIHRIPPVLAAGFIMLVELMGSWVAGLAGALLDLDSVGVIQALLNPYFLMESPTRPFNNIVLLFAGVPHELDFQLGATFASAFFALVPAQPFPETQAVFNPVFNPIPGLDYGFSITLIGELYLNFWLPGIVVGMLGVGIVMRTVYEWAIIQRPTTASIVVFCVIANNFLLGGNFSNSAPGLGLKVLPALLALYYIAGGITLHPTSGHDQAV